MWRLPCLSLLTAGLIVFSIACSRPHTWPWILGAWALTFGSAALLVREL